MPLVRHRDEEMVLPIPQSCLDHVDSMFDLTPRRSLILDALVPLSLSLPGANTCFAKWDNVVPVVKAINFGD